MIDSREPRDGDFVAYVEQIEREQLARALAPHSLSRPSADDAVARSQQSAAGSARLNAAEAQRVLQKLQQAGATGKSSPRGALIGAAIGVALIAFGLLAEGGTVLVLIGIVLLWHSFGKLRAAVRATSAARAGAAQQIARGFDSVPSTEGRKRKQ